MNPLKSVTSLETTKRAFSLLEEFKNFAFKGNGVAFGKIVDSLVKHLIMPLIAVILPGDQRYLGWKLVINGKEIPYEPCFG